MLPRGPFLKAKVFWYVLVSSKSIENIFPNPHEEVCTSAACEGRTLACKKRSKDVPPRKLNRIHKCVEIIQTTKEQDKDQHLLRPIIQRQSLTLSQTNQLTKRQANQQILLVKSTLYQKLANCKFPSSMVITCINTMSTWCIFQFSMLCEIAKRVSHPDC